jgi:signal peptidase I
MLPVFDTGANGIRIQPHSSDEIKLGDIVSYERNGELIVHRVIEIGTDSQGLYFITKGDNSAFSDGKIRFSEIKYITIGILY